MKDTKNQYRRREDWIAKSINPINFVYNLEMG